jgi:hypothetical protein
LFIDDKTVHITPTSKDLVFTKPSSTILLCDWRTGFRISPDDKGLMKLLYAIFANGDHFDAVIRLKRGKVTIGAMMMDCLIYGINTHPKSFWTDISAIGKLVLFGT